MKYTRQTKSSLAIVSFCVMGILFFGRSAWIFASTSVSLTNHFQTGLVKIELTEYEQGDGDSKQETSQKASTTYLLPGQEVTCLEVIENKASDCYIRLYENWDHKDIITSVIPKDTKDWTYGKDGFYYYKKVVKEGESISLPFILKASLELPESTAGMQISRYVRAEAIQSKNLIPDYKATHPWGTTAIIDAIHDRGDVKLGQGIRAFTVTYEGNSKQLIANQKDAFANFEQLFPGDSYSDKLLLRNTSEKTMDLYFRSEVEAENNLYDALDLTIVLTELDGSTSTIYKGNLSDSTLQNKKLVTLEKDKTALLSYTLEFPEKYDNDYTLKDGAITWIFSTEELSTNPPQTPPKTGDDVWSALYFLGLGVLCLFAALYLRQKEKEMLKKEEGGETK